MEAEFLYALRDPLGVPAHPVIFLILGVLTWALHIAAVQVLLGASALAIFGAFSKYNHWRRLADVMVSTAKIAVSVAIVLGVAPLLFVQVIYDPFWYTANVLSAWWVIGFIVFLIIGSLALFIFYGLNRHLRDTPKTRCPTSIIVAILFFLLVGFVMHALSVQMLHPEKWLEWYAPNGVVDPSGRKIHAFNLWRFGFFISLSLPVSGLWLLAYRRFIRADQVLADYRQFLLKLAIILISVGGVISLIFLGIWMLTLPENLQHFVYGPWPILTAAALLFTVVFPLVILKKLDKGIWGFLPFAIGTVALIIVAAMREALRWTMLYGIHGYNALDYKINIDWYSTLLFFITFAVLGGGVLAYLLTIAWQAAQTRGVYTPSPLVNRLGVIAIALLAIWIIHYFVVGFWVAYA